MKKMMTLVMMMTIAISAAAMPYNTARNGNRSTSAPHGTFGGRR